MKYIFCSRDALVRLFFIASLILFPALASAAITIAAPPIDVLFNDATAGGGAYIPLFQFRLQGDGATTLTNVKAAVYSTTTTNNLTTGEVNKLFLYKESGAHFGFQPDEDVQLNSGANVVTDPATSTQITITVDSAQNSVPTTPTDYFIVGKATTSPAIVNGHALYATTSANWITTSGGALGSEFVGQRKITLQQSANIKISEVSAGSATNAGDEFVELYNASDFPTDLSVLPLNLYLFNTAGGAGLKSITYFKSIIPKNGFFLITSQTNYSGSTPSDAVYTTLSGNTLAANTGLSIATSSTVANATSSAIDRLGWGTEASANCENADTVSTPCAPALTENGSSLERLARGYPDATSTASTMAAGGIDAARGNSVDHNDNSAEFVLQTTVGPQNTQSPTEFPFGGGGQDSEKPRVMGSFPGTNQTGVPIDTSFVGFSFNKIMATGTVISLTSTTTVKLTAQNSSTNLCGSVTYEPFPNNFGRCVISTQLSPSTTYTFTATSTITDLSGNALDQDQFTAGNQPYQASFTTGTSGQTQTNVTPPNVVGTTPFPGSINIPTNLAKIIIKFSQSTMNAATLNSSTITLSSSGGLAPLSSFSFDATSSLLTVVPGTLAANTKYTLTLSTGVKNMNGVGMPVLYTMIFTTGAGGDATAPAIIGVLPQTTNVLPLNSADFVFTTDDNIDPSTATSGAVTLATGGNNLPGVVSYDPVAKEGHFTATNPLPANVSDLTLTFVGGALKNISGLAIAAKTFTWTTESSNSDSTGPTILFANADQFGIAISFSEAVKITDATNIANYAIVAGGNTITLSALGGQSVSYDAAKRTAKISGLFLPPNSTFTVTVSNIHDISGNAMSSSGSVSGTVLSSTMSGGLLGPGETSGNFGPKQTDFSSSGIGFMPGLRVNPINAFVMASTTYGFEVPVSKQIPSDGKIVITFPSSADFGLCCAVTTAADNPFVNSQNTDINGPGPGTVGFSSVAKDNAAKTVTLTLNAATRLENSDTHDFLRFAVVDIKNPSIPKGLDSSGYTLDIKTQNAAGGLLESFTSNPVYISGGAVGGSATTTISGTVSGNGGNLAGVTIRLASPQTGMITAITNSSGVFSFSNITVNNQISSFGGAGTEYMMFTDPILSPTGTTTKFFGESQPVPVQATSTSLITRNYSLTPTTAAVNFAVKLTGDNSANAIFTSSEQLDVFAGGPGKFIVQSYTTGATNYNGTTIVTLPLPQVNGNWGIGVGPAMPRAMGSMNFGPPPAPNWAVPRPVNVVVSGCPTACVTTIDGASATSYTFTMTVANRTISGVLKDASGNAISSADVFASSPSTGTGSRSQSSASGSFSIKVTDGSYNVGAFVPGVGRSQDVPVTVNASGVFVNGASSASTGSSGGNPFVLTIKKSSYTITGRVTDGSNPVANAPVFAYRTDSPGHTEAMTGSDGTYTLYADSGSWRVNSFIPGFGQMTEQTVTISGASQSDINFSPSTATSFKTITGTIFESADATIDANEGISGAVVRVSGTNGSNQAVTGSDGTYSIRVPAGTYSIADIFKPGYGKIAPLDQNLAAISSIDASSDVTQNIRVKTRRTITFIIKDSSGNPLVVPQAFIDLFDTSKNMGNRTTITNGTTTTIQIADGASTTVRAFIQGVPPANISIASDDTTSSYPNNTLVLNGILEVNGNEKVKITVNTASAPLATVSGTVYTGSAQAGNELASAWVQFVDTTNNVQFGTQATSSGIYSITLANGTYQVQAMKPGYVGTPSTLVVTASTSAANLLVSQAGSSISGTVTTSSGSAASDAYVWAAKLGGGFSSTKTNSSGVYSITVDSGQWRVSAAAEGYKKTDYGSNPVSSGATGVNITLSSASGVSSKVTTSNSFTDTSVGSFSDSTVGVGVSVDGGALGSAGSTAFLSAKQTSNIPTSSDAKIIAGRAVDITATNGSSAVTNLASGKKAEITLTYTKSELTSDGLTTTAKVAAAKIASWSDDKKAWESLTTVPTYRDSSGNAIASPSSDLSGVSTVDFVTAEASHFSSYALSSASSPTAPATPTGLALAQSSTDFTVTLTWTGNTESDLSGYVIYRDTSSGGTFPKLASISSSAATYADSSAAQGVTYFYKISATNTSSDESSASAAQSITIQARGGGGSPGIGGGGGISGPSAVSPSVNTNTTAAPKSQVNTAKSPSGNGTLAGSIIEMGNLSRGVGGNGVKILQSLLANDKTIYPEGIVNGNFGPATERAVKRFQAKYGLPQIGRVGPATRAKLQQVYGAAENSVALPQTLPGTPKSGTQASSAGSGASTAITKNLSFGTKGSDVALLQQILAKDAAIYPEGIVNGNFGPATERAVKRFQAKYGLPQIGRVGPATRAKLRELRGE